MFLLVDILVIAAEIGYLSESLTFFPHSEGEVESFLPERKKFQELRRLLACQPSQH